MKVEKTGLFNKKTTCRNLAASNAKAKQPSDVLKTSELEILDVG